MQNSNDAPILRYPENLGVQQQITYDNAVAMLGRAIQLAQNVPFVWAWLDKPSDGQVLLIHLQPQSLFPNDGIRYLEQELRYVVPIAGRDLEVYEAKSGFIPGHDPAAFRVRRRYRLLKGGYTPLVLVHYTRGNAIPIIPQFNTPVRQYPLRQINEAPVFVINSEKANRPHPGQIGIGNAPGGGGSGGGGGGGGVPVGVQGVQGMPGGGGGGMPGTVGMPGAGGVGVGGVSIPGAGVGVGSMAPPPGMPMNLMQQQAMVTQQNNNMEALARRERERSRAAAVAATASASAAAAAGGGGGGGPGGPGGVPPGGPGGPQGQGGPPGPGGNRPQRIDDDDSGDETEQISTRALAMTRYRRNHELMNEVFNYAAFGEKSLPPQSSPYSIFDKTAMDAKVAKLEAEIAELKSKAAERAEKAQMAYRTSFTI